MLSPDPDFAEIIVVGDNNRCVVVKYRVDIRECEVIAVYAFYLSVHAAPALEYPDGVCLMGCKCCRLICDVVGDQGNLVKIPAVAVYYIFQHGKLDWRVPCGISFASQSGWCVDSVSCS